MVKRPALALIISAVCTLVSCGDTVGGEDVSRLYTFAQKGQMTITVSPDKITLNQSVSVTVHCQPIVAGKGRLLIAGFGDVDGSHFYIESPVIDTVDRLVDSSTSDVAQVPFSFTTTEPCVQTWVLRFSHTATYRIRAWAVIDSVFVQDSLRFYPPESQVARQHYGVPEGVNWDMSTNFLERYIHP